MEVIADELKKNGVNVDNRDVIGTHSIHTW